MFLGSTFSIPVSLAVFNVPWIEHLAPGNQVNLLGSILGGFVVLLGILLYRIYDEEIRPEYVATWSREPRQQNKLAPVSTQGKENVCV